MRKYESRVEFSSDVEVRRVDARRRQLAMFLPIQNGNWSRRRHVRHFEDQCQDRGKKRAYGPRTTTNGFETKKGRYNARHARRSCISFFLFFLFFSFSCRVFFVTVSLARPRLQTCGARGALWAAFECVTAPIGFQLRS